MLSPLILLDAQADGRGQADFLIAVADVEAVQYIGAVPHQTGIPGNRGRAGNFGVIGVVADDERCLGYHRHHVEGRQRGEGGGAVAGSAGMGGAKTDYFLSVTM